MDKLSSLSVFFPAYNDAKTIGDLIAKTLKLLPKIARNYEVIVVNDGSTDETASVLLRFKKNYPQLKIITHGQNRGYGGALISGFKNCTKNWVFYTDGDGQYDPKDLIKLVNKVKPNIDVINGYKLKRNDNLIRVIAGNLYNSIAHQLYQLPIKDFTCDFRLIRRSFLQKIKLTKKSGIICLELILKLKSIGANFTETGVNHYARKFGSSQFFRFQHLWNNFSELINLRV